MDRKVKVYTASPQGFSTTTRSFLAQHVSDLEVIGFEVLNPWAMGPVKEYRAADRIAGRDKRWETKAQLNQITGQGNIGAIVASDLITADLNGDPPDTGTVSEIAGAAMICKPVFAWRDDFRQSGEEGSYVNLQVEAFIHFSKGELFVGPDAYEKLLKRLARFEQEFRFS